MSVFSDRLQFGRNIKHLRPPQTRRPREPVRHFTEALFEEYGISLVKTSVMGWGDIYELSKFLVEDARRRVGLGGKADFRDYFNSVNNLNLFQQDKLSHTHHELRYFPESMVVLPQGRTSYDDFLRSGDKKLGVITLRPSGKAPRLREVLYVPAWRLV